jgi:hypothetical protein
MATILSQSRHQRQHASPLIEAEPDRPFLAAIIIHGATRVGQTVGNVPEGSV